MDLKQGNSYSDVALLKPIGGRFMKKSRGSNRKNENACILRGNLRNEKDIPVTVAGCPFNDNFQVNSNFTSYIL